MAWSKGIDVWVDDTRALSAKTTFDDRAVGELLINSVGGQDTHIHLSTPAEKLTGATV